jgi:hypothetical protein
MANFAAGRKAISICDRCGQTFKLSALKELVIKTKKTNIMVCGECYEPDQPQLMQGMRPIIDPQALRNPRPDQARGPSGNLSSIDIQWGWAPVGGSFAVAGTPNNLVATTTVGAVTVTVL